MRKEQTKTKRKHQNFCFIFVLFVSIFYFVSSGGSFTSWCCPCQVATYSEERWETL